MALNYLWNKRDQATPDSGAYEFVPPCSSSPTPTSTLSGTAGAAHRPSGAGCGCSQSTSLWQLEHQFVDAPCMIILMPGLCASSSFCSHHGHLDEVGRRALLGALMAARCKPARRGRWRRFPGRYRRRPNLPSRRSRHGSRSAGLVHVLLHAGSAGSTCRYTAAAVVLDAEVRQPGTAAHAVDEPKLMTLA